MRKFLLIAAVCLVAPICQALVVLQYHHISTDTPPSTSLSPALFRQHLAIIEEQGYRVLALPDVMQALKSGQSLPDKSVVITFDDAYDSIYLAAFPLLKQRGWPFTIFVATEPVERGLRGFITWEQLQEMGRFGATLANHSHSHTHFLRQLDNESTNQWRQRIRDEIEQAENIIKQRTGQSHKLLAYPYGEYNRAIRNIVRDLGFTAFAQQSGPIPGSTSHPLYDSLALPRFPFGGIYGSAEDFAVKLATLAMPIDSVKVVDEKGSDIRDTVLARDQLRPQLQLSLQKNLPVVQCFASGQGAVPIERDGNEIIVQAPKAIPVGRSRYNCTAASDQSGRFYWYSHFFIRKNNDGSWYPEP